MDKGTFRTAESRPIEKNQGIVSRQQKKVGIVSALITEPQLLILDEPTSGLDPLMQQTFYNILSRRTGSGGMTILLFVVMY